MGYEIKPGYDGVYGEPVFENAQAKSGISSIDNEKKVKNSKQEGLNRFF